MERFTTLLYKGEQPVRSICQFLNWTQRTREKDHFFPETGNMVPDDAQDTFPVPPPEDEH